MIATILALCIIAAGVAFAVKFIRRYRSGPGGGFQCRNCRYLIRSFDDGVRCGYGGGDVFKTPVHITNCMDFENR